MSTQETCSVFNMSRCRQYAPAALWLLLGGAICIGVFLAAYSWERRSIRREFDSLAEDRFHAVRNVIDDSMRLLQFADNVFLVGPQANSPEFPNYVRSLATAFKGDLSQYPAIRAATWMPRVPRQERIAYQRAAQTLVDPTFQFGKPSDSTDPGSDQQREEYFFADLCITTTSRHDRPGEDLTPNSAEWKVMERARDAGLIVASEPIRTSADPDDSFGYHLFVPLYRGNPKDIASRRQAMMTGFLCIDMDIGKSVAKAFRDISPVGIDVWVSDDTDGKKTPICRHTSRLKSPAAASVGYELESTWTMEFYGRKLSLRCCSTPVFWTDHPIWQPWVLLCGGLALTLTGVGYRLNLAWHAIAIERTVATRMAALCQNIEPRQRMK